MDSLEQDYASGLFDTAKPPCVSLYQPTHRHHPDNAQDPIRYRNLVKSVSESLRQKYAAREVDAWLAPVAALASDIDFWQHTLDGLAVLAAPGLFRVYRVQRPVPELAIAADSFHLKPLRRVMQSADRFQILAISRDAIRMFEGNRDVVDEITPAEGVPTTLVEALGDELTEPRLTVSSYGHGAEGPAMYHGHGGRKDQIDLDAERYFREVDRTVLEHHSRPTGLPLVLAGLPENQSLFRSVSRNPFLLDAGIAYGPEALSAESLRDAAWPVIEPRYRERLAGFVQRFHTQHGTGLATDALDEAVRAATQGRVATLLVDADRQIAGRIDVAGGRWVRSELTSPEADDVLDDLGELVVKHGGEWIIVPSRDMPTQNGVAAIYRY